MIKTFLFLAVFSSTASATVVLGTVEFSDEGPIALGDYFVHTEARGFGASWVFGSLDIDTFRVFDYSIGLGFTYYQLPFGTRVGQNDPPNGPIIVSNHTPPDSEATFDIPEGGSIFLAFDFVDTFGWIELENNAGVVTSGGSATAFDLPGIIVGTSQGIPEPSSLVLGLTSSFFFFRRKRD